MKFFKRGKEFELRGIIGRLGNIIKYNGMTNLIQKEQHGVIAQIFSVEVQTPKSCISLYLQQVLENNSNVFDNISTALPPTKDHDHAIHLVPGSVPPNIRTCRYP